MKQSTSCEITKGVKWMKRAADACMGKNREFTYMSEDLLLALTIPTHSPSEELEFWFDCIVFERTHQHIVRHKELGKYVGSSRPDKKAKKAPKGMRNISLRINLKRFVEICRQRLCLDAYEDTVEFVEMLKEKVVSLFPPLEIVCQPQCVWFGFCPTAFKICYANQSNKLKKARENLVSKATKLKKKYAKNDLYYSEKDK